MSEINKSQRLFVKNQVSRIKKKLEAPVKTIGGTKIKIKEEYNSKGRED